jgi:RHS repeat-associated protein
MTVNGKMEYWGNSYGYDPWGNLISKTPSKCSAENLNEAAWTNNQLHTISGSDNTYDSAGNMTHDATTGLNYTYDAENRITSAGGYAYTYDADGNRVEKSNGSTGTIYWYMSPGIVAESDLSGNAKSEYVFFDGERVARKDFPGNTISYYFSDQLKTASVITDSAGNIKEDEDYYPWGGELQFVNSDSNHYKFTSKERDAESGLDYFGARYYGNWLSRWMSPDWAAKPEAVPYSDLGDPQSLNLYSYVRNVPTVKVDRDGHGIIDPATWIKLAEKATDIGTGLGKGVANFFIKWDNGNRSLLNKIGGHYQPLEEFKPSNATQQKAMGAGEGAASLGLAIGGARGGTEPEGAAGKSGTVPESIPAGPSPRPTAAQQRAINEMGEAHGCHTCGTTEPGTKSGNWVGDHQPSTALNPPGNPQVYKPQCLQCSRQQGGQVSATVKAANKQADSQ